MIRPSLFAIALLAAAPVVARPAPAPVVPVPAVPSLQQRVEAALSAAPKGTRIGLLVVDDQGREVVAVLPDQRFIPASNTKMFTTAAAYAVMGNDPMVEITGATSIWLTPPAHAGKTKGLRDAIIKGGGGISLSTAADCARDCLSGMVTGLAGQTRKIGNIIADDTAFVDQRWSPGMSWNNIPTDSGTATSALITDNNELPLVVTPGEVGQPPQVSVSPYFTLRNEARTVAAGAAAKLAFDRAVNGRELRVFGTIAVGAQPWRELLGIDDPADYAGWALAQALTARGVKVTGAISVRHRPVALGPDMTAANMQPERNAASGVVRPATSLDQEVSLINKVSQNLHAEALLRRVGLAAAAQNIFPTQDAAWAQPGSLEAGLAAMRDVLARVGVPRAGYDFSDGSGMSTYNRVSPRAAVALLRWALTQPWGVKWRASLPVGGVDGTLKRRFAGTLLAGNLWAKTGTLNATNALSGYMKAASGRELTFSIFANDVPEGTSALAAMDAALALIAAAN